MSLALSGRALHYSYTTLCVCENVHGMAQLVVIASLIDAPQPLTAPSHRQNKQTDRQPHHCLKRDALSLGANAERLRVRSQYIQRTSDQQSKSTRNVHTNFSRFSPPSLAGRIFLAPRGEAPISLWRPSPSSYLVARRPSPFYQRSPAPA